MTHRVLVMGGAGFVGSHVCDRLLEQGHGVIAVDDFSTGSHDNVAHLLDHPRFSLRRHDVAVPLDVKVDRVYNLASPASPVHYQADPIRTTMTNVLGALNALRLADRYGARVLLASTSEVYGDPEVHPQPETYWGRVNPNGIRACYDEGKRCAESLAMDYFRQHGTCVKIARIFNTYGPRMAPDDGRVVSKFVLQALRGDEVTIYGDGSQTRCFCYVEDLVDGLMLLMEHPAEMGPVNLGNPAEITVRELAELVIRLTESSSRITHEPLRQDDPKARRPDITKARVILGFEPRVPLTEGLARMIESVREVSAVNLRSIVPGLGGATPRSAPSGVHVLGQRSR
jgi:UDP-glucuronate decarboxylase